MADHSAKTTEVPKRGKSPDGDDHWLDNLDTPRGEKEEGGVEEDQVDEDLPEDDDEEFDDDDDDEEDF